MRFYFLVSLLKNGSKILHCVVGLCKNFILFVIY